MEARCRKCGKPLHNPESIARGMGAACAGIVTKRRSFSSSRSTQHGVIYPPIERNHTNTKLFCFEEEPQTTVPNALTEFPADLLNLVLSAPTAGSIAKQVKKFSRQQKQNEAHSIKLLKRIRRMCIECRLPFWPGLSSNLQPIPCIPCCEDGWKIGENSRFISKEELVAYLSRYGILGQEQLRTAM